jgi:LmbE family N-acetylglucosaminyl deacetylase
LQTYQAFFKINLKSESFSLEGKKCLLLAPHPDDESIGAGGTLALYTEKFSVACLTNGNKGIRETLPKQAEVIREKEFRSVMGLLKVPEVFWLNIEDNHLMDGYEVFQQLDLSPYDVIFLPNLLDQHPDHKAVSCLLHRYFKQYPHRAKAGLQLAFYEVWGALPLPNAFVDISSVVELKRSMINAHLSQVEKKDFASMILALNQYRGLNRGVFSAEAFCVMGLSLFFQLVESLAFCEFVS